MNEEKYPNQKPNWQEAFKGRDVVRGGEIVENLLSEGVGLPVYSRDYQEKKTKFFVDREVGQEDFTVRQKEENNRKLLGLLIPTQDKNEFVYLGIEEGGFVFRTSDNKASEFHKDTATSFDFSWKRFGDYIVNSIGEIIERKTSISIKEESDPSRFTEIVLSAVEKERERMKQIKEKRTVVRDDLMKKLFGGQ